MLILRNSHTYTKGNFNLEKDLARQRQERKEINLTNKMKKGTERGQEEVKRGNQPSRISEKENKENAFLVSLTNGLLLPTKSSMKHLDLRKRELKVKLQSILIKCLILQIQKAEEQEITCLESCGQR